MKLPEILQLRNTLHGAGSFCGIDLKALSKVLVCIYLIITISSYDKCLSYISIFYDTAETLSKV